MKAFRIVMILSLLALSLAFTPTVAQAGKFTSYTSSIQLQNLDNVDGQISLNFYNKDCSDPCTPTTVNTTITANGQKFWFPLPNEVTAGFNGSVVVTSTTNVASISNVLGNDGAAAASYVADSAGNTTLTLPVLMKENSGYTTWFNVQNAGTTTATVEVRYSDDAAGAAPKTASIKPGSAHTFDQGLETHARKFFAGTVTSTNGVNLVATVLIESTVLMQAYTGFKDGSLNPVMPLINIQPARGIQTGVNLANTGSTATDVTVTYTPSPGYGTACYEKQTVPAKDFKPFALYVFSSGATPAGIETNCAKGSRFVGSAKVTTNSASQKLAVIVNQLEGSGAGSSYNGFDPGTATSKFVAPLIMDRNSTKYRLYTSINLMNVGDVTTKVTCTFTGTGSSQPWTSGDIAPNAGTFHIQNGYFTTFPYVGGASCTASAPGAKIIAVINEAQANATASDQNMTYEAINVTP